MDHFRYGTEVAASGANSHSYVLELVGFRKRVLEIGCSAGAVTAALAEQGCEIVGVELDPVTAERARAHASDVVVGDVEHLDLFARYGAGSFDVVVLGDVLEHLTQPVEMLDRARRLLKAGGYVVMSVPNVAHGDVRLALLAGRFDYQPLGLLDATHLRFFTIATLEQAVREAGLVPVEIRRVRAGIGETEIGVELDRFPAELVEEVRADPEAETYQFVVRAVVDDAEQAVRALHEREERVTAERDQLEQEVVALREEVAELRVARTALAEELRALRATRLFRWAAPLRDLYGSFRRPR